MEKAARLEKHQQADFRARCTLNNKCQADSEFSIARRGGIISTWLVTNSRPSAGAQSPDHPPPHIEE
eukprot:8797795-Prorocentrum_lima.AAC.1